MSTKRRLRPEDYTVGWLCALALTEQVAAIKMLDEQHQEIPKPSRDYNTYTYGSIGSHNVVIACLPLSQPGTTSASRMANFLPTSFPNMRLYLFVGIGGGIPYNPPKQDPSADIHLGDVVVGLDHTPGVAGVVQYDFIRDHGEGARELLGGFDKPNLELLTALGKVFANCVTRDSKPQVHLGKLTGLMPDFSRPPPGGDNFYKSTYKHVDGEPNCDHCPADELVVRKERQETSIPVFHQGQILSGNSVIKNAQRRDELSREHPYARCFEMEAAGVVDQTHCLVIRGIADYADSHKNQMWQPYAAGTAAAFARELLLTVQPSVVAQLRTIAPTTVQAVDLPFGGQPESGNVRWMVPKSTNTLFTGRTNILEKLGHSLRPHTHSSPMSEQQRRFVIVGYGGIGKSEVCLKFANDQRRHFWGIFWIDASSEQTARQTFIDIGKMCGANAENFEQVKTWLANTRHSWLLIIDNADNPHINYAMFFPSGDRGNIILTTRNPQCRRHQSIGYEDLDHLDLQDAMSLLFEAAEIAVSSRENNKEVAERVVRALDFHTLAIIQAGASINLRFCSLEEYPTRLRQQEEQVLKYCPEQEQSTYGSVYATFEISATHLESSPDQTAADALSLLPILGFIHFQKIPELMFFRARDKAIAIHKDIDVNGPRDENYLLSELQVSRLPLFMVPRNEIPKHVFLWRWREALNLLESYSIISIGGSQENLSFSMHPLAHKWSRVRHGLASRKEGWRAAGSVIALSMWGLDYDLFHEKLRSHVGSYLDHPIDEYMAGMMELEICQTQFHICYLTFDFHDAPKLRFLLQILQTFEAWTGASGESRLHVQTLTARCFMGEGEHGKAVELLEQLVNHDRSHSVYAQCVLAEAYMDSKQHQKAIPLLEDIVEIRKRTQVPEDARLIWSQHELGIAYIETTQFERAAKLLEHVVEREKRTLVPTHHDLLSSQHTLAVAYIGMGSGHCGRAAELLEHVVRVRGKTLAPDDYRLLGSQHVLAVAYIGMGSGHCGRAAELLEHVVRMEEKTLGPNDPKLVASQKRLKKVHRLIEAEKDAESMTDSRETVSPSS